MSSWKANKNYKLRYSLRNAADEAAMAAAPVSATEPKAAGNAAAAAAYTAVPGYATYIVHVEAFAQRAGLTQSQIMQVIDRRLT